MTRSTLKFKSVNKDRLFYDRFEYCVSFYLEEVSCLRVLDHEYINSWIARRQEWREIARKRWSTASGSVSTIMSRRWREITDTTVSNLHCLANFLLDARAEFKLVVSVDQGYVYSNDLNLIEQLAGLLILQDKSYSRAEINRPKNTIKLKNCEHQYRSYFRGIKLSAQQKDHLIDFLYNQRASVRVSPALQRWTDQPFDRTQDHFFVDHDSQTWLTMLNLVVSGLVRKTVHLIPAK